MDNSGSTDAIATPWRSQPMQRPRCTSYAEHADRRMQPSGVLGAVSFTSTVRVRHRRGDSARGKSEAAALRREIRVARDLESMTQAGKQTVVHTVKTNASFRSD